MASEPKLLRLPLEIWRNSVLPLLSLVDLCYLDSAALNVSIRPNVLASFAEFEVTSKVVIFPEVLEWVIGKRIKPLWVHVTEDITVQGLLRLTEYCPPLRSLQTCCYDRAVERVQARSRYYVDKNAYYEVRELHEEWIIAVLENGHQLQELLLREYHDGELWDEILPRIAHRCVHLNKLGCCYHGINDSTAMRDSYKFLIHGKYFSLRTGTLWTPFNVLSAVACHFPALTHVVLETTATEPMDTHVLQLARHSTELKHVALHVELSDTTLIEFCRLQPHIVELHLWLPSGYAYSADTMRSVLALLPGLQVFYYFAPGCRPGGFNQLYRAVADTQQAVRTLGICCTSCLTDSCWEYVLQKCTQLRTVYSDAGEGTSNLRCLFMRYRVRIKRWPWGEFTENPGA